MQAKQTLSIHAMPCHANVSCANPQKTERKKKMWILENECNRCEASKARLFIQNRNVDEEKNRNKKQTKQVGINSMPFYLSPSVETQPFEKCEVTIKS